MVKMFQNMLSIHELDLALYQTILGQNTINKVCLCEDTVPPLQPYSCSLVVRNQILTVLMFLEFLQHKAVARCSSNLNLTFNSLVFGEILGT